MSVVGQIGRNEVTLMGVEAHELYLFSLCQLILSVR